MTQDFNDNPNPYAPPEQLELKLTASESNDNPDHVLATRGSRLSAAFIDVLFIALCFGFGIFIISLSPKHSLTLNIVGPGSGIEGGEAFARDIQRDIITVFVCWFSGVLVQAYLIASSGQTIGKRWLRIRIVKLDGSPAGFVRGAFLRSWVLGAFAYLGWAIMLIGSLMIFSDEQRCLHDYIAGTKVIVAV